MFVIVWLIGFVALFAALTIISIILDGEVAPVIFGLLTGLFLVAIFFVSIEWYAAGKKAEVYNRKAGTNYTRSEVFWSGSVIRHMIEGNIERKEIDIDGSLKLDLEQ